METVIKENFNGGTGRVIIKHILNDQELNGKCKMFAEVTIEPGSSLGYHEHHGNSETYYIIKGQGEYNDNGTIRQVNVGDRTFT
ncbi:MAG: cupin domain-containing protein, partial [Otoolea sp.]